VKTIELIKVVLNIEPKISQTFKDAYIQAVWNNISETKHTTSTENMLAQITQMLKDQNLHLNKVETALK
jgi:hypothetical protein